MIYISHRGNTCQKIIELENSPAYIINALNSSLDVEIDIWYDKGFWLGHDNPRYKINTNFLINNRLWCHAKNLEALYELSKINTRYFWHQNDDYTLTSDNIIWSYPGQKVNKKSVCVLPEICGYVIGQKIVNCYGICSDFILKWKK